MQNQNLISQLRRAIGKQCLDDFKRKYFPHRFTLPSSRYHLDCDRLIFDIGNQKKARRIVSVVPRGNGKSEHFAFLLPIYCIVYGLKKYIPIITDTAGLATDHVNSIKEELEENELLAQDFPEACGEGPKWTEGEIITRNGVKVKAFGSEGKIRGRKQGADRPDLIIVDDPENDENVSSSEQREKRRNWFYKAVAKAGYIKTTPIVVSGTLIHPDCLVKNCMDNPAYETLFYQSVEKWSDSPLWDEWKRIFQDRATGGIGQAEAFFKQNQEAMLAGTKVLWPEMEDYHDLMVLRESEGEAAFDSEKQNVPIDPEKQLFKNFYYFERFFTDKESGRLKIVFDGAEKEIVEIYGACDPDLGKEGNCFTAIIVLGKDIDGYLNVLEAIVERMVPDEAIRRIIMLPYDFVAFGIESVAFQEFMYTSLEEAARKAGRYNISPFPIKNEGIKKEIRIQKLQPLINNGTIRFLRDQFRLLEQLKYYFPQTKDYVDGPDGLQMAVKAAQSGVITFQGE